ncbi:hypothetical protein HHI36_015606 [Cryptolaemus montrouzieri]|uniref:5-azacytidine-induced protein 1 n=1 Tax=Cryptolaemus montrouzieri TaxID=559131 RepID=A0ABD2N7D4_9CUCU
MPDSPRKNPIFPEFNQKNEQNYSYKSLLFTVIQHISNSEGKQEDTNTQCIKTVEVFEEQRDENDFDLNLTVNNWLEELNLKTVQQKELETDKYIKEVRQRCGNSETATVSSRDLPSLSEIDIDDLFKLEIDENTEEQHDKSDIQTISPSSSPPPRSNKLLCKESNEKVFRKATKPKSPARKPPSNKFHTEKSVENNKTVRSNKTFSKAKFIAMPIKLKKTCESPRKNADLVEDNIETWIGKQEMHPRGKKAVFTDLIDRVDDLRSTTEIICKDIPVDAAPTPEENKQENFDDLETLIEALEHQDKTSQNSIKTMKKIVTSELSNSIILNENEENMSFKRRNDKIEDNPNAEITSVTSEGMNQKTTSGLTSPSESQGSRNEDNNSVCKHFKNVQKQELLEESKQAQNDVKVDMCGGDHSRTRPCNGHHNYKELLSYLDEVDKKCTKTLEVAKERAQTASKLVLESSNLFETMPKVEDLLTHTPGELASFIIDLSLRVKDKTSCIALLQSELASLRDKVLTQSKQAEAMLRHKLKEKKEETERIAKRHQKFIDQLMEEKKTMARKCEELVEEMTAMEDKYVSNMKAVEHKHQVEIQKMKDMNAASEKLRRERWIEGRTQKIKEMAVKSIEPEVERMEKRHQEELSNLRALHKREIEEMELRAARKLQEHSESVREQLIQDREKALAHERDVMRLRYEKLVESEERSYQEQRRRLLADHANRVAECEEREAQVVAEKERAIKQAQDEFEEKLQAAARRHANEMKLVKETTVMEMENWKNSFRKQQSALLMEKETSIRRECRKERDREIELVIERLENEANKARTQMEQTTENRIKRIREKYEAEMRDLEMLEKDAQNKYCEARSKLLEYEDVILTLRTSIRQLETQLTEEKLKRSKLEAEREEIRQAIRKEYEDKMQSLENEVEELRTSGDKQVEQLYSRVRVSLARKDELLAELSNDYKALKEKCVYLENMIEQQRKEFMINN